MRLALGALLLISLNASAAEAPLRFVLPDSWAMPMVQLERGQPTQGILYDAMLSLATQVGVPAEFHVLPRARVQGAMEHGEVDVRCYAAQSWLPNQSGDYIWSIPLWTQPDVLVSRRGLPLAVVPANLPRQTIGTVLGYSYPTLQPLFDNGHLLREDARSQDQALEKLQVLQQQMADRETRLELVLKGANDGWWDWDLRTDGIWWSRGIEALFGHPGANARQVSGPEGRIGGFVEGLAHGLLISSLPLR